MPLFAHSAVPDRSHRDSARPGFLALWCRRHRRRDPDLHQKGDGEPRLNASTGIGTYNTSDTSVGISGSNEIVSYSLQAGHYSTDGVSAIHNKSSSSYNPDRDGYRNDSLSGSSPCGRQAATKSASTSWRQTEPAVMTRPPKHATSKATRTLRPIQSIHATSYTRTGPAPCALAAAPTT